MKMKKEILNFINRYKITLTAAIIASIIMPKFFDGPIEGNVISVLSVLYFIAVGSFLVDKLFIIYNNRIIENIKKRYSTLNENNINKVFIFAKTVSYVLIVLIQYLLYKWSFYLSISEEKIKNNDDIIKMICCAMVVIVMIIFIISFFTIKEKKISIKDYFLDVFFNFIFLFLIECVISIGFLALYFMYEVLLGGIECSISRRVITFTMSAIFIAGSFINIEMVGDKHNVLSKIIVRYIMQIMVFIGFIFFYVYLIKIILKLELPSNEVFVVCCVLFSLGLFTSLMSLGLSKENMYNKFIEILPIAFTPALILQIISIGLRINQYGLTGMRYMGIVFIIFESVYLVYYILDEIFKIKKIKLENIFLSLCFIIVVVFFIPKINVYEFPKIYNSIFIKNTDAETNNALSYDFISEYEEDKVVDFNDMENIKEK